MSPAASHFERHTHPPDRRTFARKQIRSLAYVELGKGNGGIVLNVSEGGMAIQAVMSLSGNELPQLRVQLAHSKKQIQAKGRIAWTGELRKLAGVEFVDLTEETRAQIREWVSLETLAHEADPSPGTSTEEAAATEELLEPAKPVVEELPLPDRVDRGRPVAAPQSPAHFSALEAAGLRPRPSSVPDTLPGPACPPEMWPPAAPAAAEPSVTASSTASSSSTWSSASEPPASSFMAPPAVNPSSPTAEADAAVAPTAPARSLRDSAELPADRFGFKAAAQPQPAVSTVRLREDRDRWKLTSGAGVFVLVSLAAGWLAGHGALRGMFQKVAGNAVDGKVAAENALARPVNSATASKIEIVDLNNQHWTIPLQGPIESQNSRQFEGSNSRSRQSAMNFREWTLSPPSHPQNASAQPKANPPVLTPSASEPENVLPPSEPGEARGAIVVPPPAAGNSNDGLQAGELIQKVEPLYPSAAMEQRVEGTVKIYAVIGEDGNIKRVQALSGPSVLIPAALDAVRQWHYSPTRLNGQPIQTQRQITIVFQLAKPTAR